MTPDANPLIGPMPGVRGFWVAAGLSLNGFGGGGGIGRAVARLDHGGRSRASTSRRTGRGDSRTRTAIPKFAAALARETYADYYRLRFPYDADVAGRPRRLSALHQRLEAGGRRLRHEGRLGARGPPSPGRAVDAQRAAATGARVGTAGLVRAGGGGAPGGPRAGRDHRPELVRQDRGRRAGRAGAPPARRRERHRPPDRLDDLHPVPRCQWGHRRRRHRRPATTSTASASSPAPATSPPTSAGSSPAPPTTRRSTGRPSTTEPTPGRSSACGVRAPATSSARITRDPVDDAALPIRQARSIRVGGFGGTRDAPQLRRRARLGAARSSRPTRSRSGTRCWPPAASTASSRSAIGRWSRCASRRATATSAPS